MGWAMSPAGTLPLTATANSIFGSTSAFSSSVSLGRGVAGAAASPVPGTEAAACFLMCSAV